jgi:hypothetical protein
MDGIEAWDANGQRIPLPMEPKLHLPTDCGSGSTRAIDSEKYGSYS